MELSLSVNIGKLRKENAMTQEQLAEALGVTFAAVSKWERGVATPDLNLIAKMADLFGVSLDALVGFAVQNASADCLAQRICALRREKKYEEAFTEAEKALLKYPNDFRIVYCCGEVYEVAGVERKNEKYIRRGIGLLEHAILLLSQNTDPDISSVTIYNEIAQGYIALGQPDKGLEILKKHNVSGVNSPLLAWLYACNDRYNPDEAAPYLMQSFLDIVTAAIRTMTAYANYYAKRGGQKESLNAILWLVHMLESIKTDVNAVAYVDKILAPCYAECANLSDRLGRQKDVEPYLRRAYFVAKAFDSAPSYKVSNIKFSVGDVSHATVYDDLGRSAGEAVEYQITQEDRNEGLYKIWKRIEEEEGERSLCIKNGGEQG